MPNETKGDLLACRPLFFLLNQKFEWIQKQKLICDEEHLVLKYTQLN